MQRHNVCTAPAAARLPSSLRANPDALATTLKQLAERLQLSQTTVSRALNGYSDVSAETRALVMQTAQELDYQPNMTARRLALGRTEAVGVVYPVDADFMGNALFLDMMRGAADRFAESGTDVLMVISRDTTELSAYQRLVKGRRVDGVLVAHTQVQDPRIDFLRQESMPFVCYGRTANCDDFAWLDFDNEAGAMLAVAELQQRGHRRIAYVHAPLEFNFAQQRHAGFVRGMRAAQLPRLPGHEISGGLDRRSGFAAGSALLALPRRPTAIVVDNSLCGVGVVRALMQAGVVVGRDISVIVYDGVPADTLLVDANIAAIDQPTARDSGRTMADMLMTLIAGKALRAPHVLRQPVFVPGHSVGPASAD